MTKSHRVLLIDDDPDQLLLFTALLEQARFEVVTANNGYDGLQKLSEEGVDIIVTDISMPGMDGFEFAAEVRSLPTKIPLVLLTAGTEACQMTSKSFRADAFCLKRNIRQSLLPKMKEILEPELPPGPAQG